MIPSASVYASPAASRQPVQNSRSGWFATPFLQDSFILYFMPVYPGALDVYDAHKDNGNILNR
jgi:hypothetical protein